MNGLIILSSLLGLWLHGYAIKCVWDLKKSKGVALYIGGWVLVSFVRFAAVRL